MRLTLEALIALARSSTPAPQPCWQKIPPSPLTLASPRLQTLAFSSRRKAAECLKSSCARTQQSSKQHPFVPRTRPGCRTRGGDRGGRRRTLPFRSMARADSGSPDRCTRPISRHRALVVFEPFSSDSPGTGAIQQCTRRIAPLRLVAAHRRRCPDFLANAGDLLCPSGAANRRRNRHSRQSRVGEPRTQVCDGTGQTRRRTETRARSYPTGGSAPSCARPR